MRYAIIDNSTLTGVERLLGQIPVKTKALVDMDILCLESFVEAILFYDVVAFIDDYKPEYSKERRAFFPKLPPLDMGQLDYSALANKTAEIMTDIVPRVEAGSFTDKDFEPFFEMLRMNVIFTWDMSSSVYFLTEKMLETASGIDVDKYGKLNSAIYDELADHGFSLGTGWTIRDPVLIDSEGRTIGPDYQVVDKEGSFRSAKMSKQARAFFAGLSWLAFRTIFYTLVCNSLHVDLFLHPIRHAFQTNFLSQMHRDNPSLFKPIVDAMNDSADSALNVIFAKTQPVVTKHRIPLFVAWLSQKVVDPRRFIQTAYDLRTEPPFLEARKRLSDLELTITEADSTRYLLEANKLIGEVDATLQAITAKYHASTPQGTPLSSLITLWNLSTIATHLPQVPDLNLRVPQLEPLNRVIPQRHFKALSRAMVSDLSGISRLGTLYDNITSSVVVDPKAWSGDPKVEQEAYRKYKSYWKIPM